MALSVKNLLNNLYSKTKDRIKYIKRRQPFGYKKTEEGWTITKEGYNYDPTTEDDEVYLCIIDGQTIDDVKEVEKHGDDLVLEYEDKHCAITSKPLVIRGTQLYFTKHGFKGTMAINRDTLMSGDVYNPSKSREVKRKIDKDVVESEEYDIGLKPEELELDESGDNYIVESKQMGDIEALLGSKATLKESNKAKRYRALLRIDTTNRKKLLMALGSGVALGIYLYPYVVGA